MICWPAYLVGLFTVGLVIFDMVYNNWTDLPMHSLIGISLTLLLVGLCYLIGPNLTGGVLIVPTLAIGIFTLGMFFTGYRLKKQGCCVKCSEEPAPVPATESCPPPAPEEPSCPNQLKATRLI